MEFIKTHETHENVRVCVCYTYANHLSTFCIIKKKMIKITFSKQHRI